MILAHPELEHYLEWPTDRPAVLIIEDPTLFLNLMQELTDQHNGNEGRFVCSAENKEISLSKQILLIRDLFSVDLNDRKIFNGVLKYLEGIAAEDFFIETAEIKAMILKYADQLCSSVIEPIFSDENIAFSDIMKTAGIHLENDDDPLIRLLDYISAAKHFLKIKLVVLVGIRVYLTEEKYQMLCEEILAEGLSLLFIESAAYPRRCNECMMIIDRDLCEIIFD